MHCYNINIALNQKCEINDPWIRGSGTRCGCGQYGQIVKCIKLLKNKTSSLLPNIWEKLNAYSWFLLSPRSSFWNPWPLNFHSHFVRNYCSLLDYWNTLSIGLHGVRLLYWKRGCDIWPHSEREFILDHLSHSSNLLQLVVRLYYQFLLENYKVIL